MKNKKYEIIEKRTITIKDGSNVYKAEIPLDFIVTDEWIEEKMSNAELNKCIDWLKNKGFVKNGDRWEYLKDKKISFRLPMFFKDYNNYRLMVKFGYVNASSFHVPEMGIGYRTLEDFPLELPEKCSIFINNINSWNSKFYVDIYENFIFSKTDKNINDYYYFSEILKRLKKNDYADKKEIEKIKRFLHHHKEYLEHNEDYQNLIKSLETIDKFNL